MIVRRALSNSLDDAARCNDVPVAAMLAHWRLVNKQANDTDAALLVEHFGSVPDTKRQAATAMRLYHLCGSWRDAVQFIVDNFADLSDLYDLPSPADFPTYRA